MQLPSLVHSYSPGQLLPPPLLAAVCGVAAAAYLVLWHTTMTGPTVAGLVGFAVAGVVATTVPADTRMICRPPPAAPVVPPLMNRRCPARMPAG